MARRGVNFALREVDKGYNQLKRQLEALRQSNEGAHVKAGVLGDAAAAENSDGMTNAQLAAIHEFGAPKANIPQRSWIRSTFDNNRLQYLAMLALLLKAFYEGKMPLERVLGLVGAKMSADIKNRVTRGEPIPPPNAPSVLRRKLKKGGAKIRNAQGRFSKEGGPVRTLIDTGRMVASVSWQVVMGSSKGGGKKRG
jgi:hypothetical protein